MVIIVLKIAIVVSALLVMLSSNPIHMVLAVILLFLNSAAYLFLLDMEFLALVFIIVYVGAIAVLFLFVCMMLNVKIEELKNIFFNYFPISMFFLFFLLLQFLFFILNSFDFYQILPFYNNWFDLYFFYENLFLMGSLIYTDFLAIFLFSGCALLVAMIGSIYLTLYHKLDVKRQLIARQVKLDSLIFKN